MGTTCTAAIVSPERLTIAQVGDSRAYLLRKGQLRALTQDQSVAAKSGVPGVVSADQAESSDHRAVLAQALGTRPNVQPVVTDFEVDDGDRVLLCSDGLHGVLSD